MAVHDVFSISCCGTMGRRIAVSDGVPFYCRLAIACYLVFLGECRAHEAVLKVRRGRPGALQTHQQEQFVEAFQMYLTHLR